MKFMYLISSVLLLFAANVFAAEGEPEPDYVYVPDVTLDTNGKGTVDVWINTYVEEYLTFTMNIYLPDGFTIDKDRRGNYAFSFNTEEDVVYDHAMSSMDHEGYVRILGMSITNTPILSGDHRLFSFGITAPEDFTEASTGSLKKMDFGEGTDPETAKDHYLPDVSFAINPFNVETGVNEIIEGKETVTVYNLQGIELLKDAAWENLTDLPNGIYIINGVKTAVR